MIVVALAVLVAADRQGWLLYRGGDWQRYHGKLFTVLYVIDGDTLVLDATDGGRRSTKVRLWGIDAPEIAHSDKNQDAQPFADECASLAKTLCEGQSVRLYLESHRHRGKYGRLLAHVEFADGTVLNERLIAAGLARADERFSHDRMQRYTLLELQAKRDRAGMWR